MNKTEALKQLNKPIDLRALPREEARVEIAKDILAALRTRKLIAKREVFADMVSVTGSEVIDNLNRGWGVGEERLRNAARCDVCAKGAAVVAIVARGQSTFCPVDYGDVNLACAPYFTAGELTMMEDYFEDESRGELSGKQALTSICSTIIESGGVHVIPNQESE